ncbi:related to regulator of ribosome biogenesis [Cephalotrichum gorgonifer]|uniref:Ribosome biogenesis regulatory protein n=1 Tax=Cephalotrichum gorgonifer TaxID=2041049 RepID=A0AAE8SQI8_9PEZI|nr:related to regulator of ribosome biogenesis [Cephalotrichum gorgonifer]
MAITEAPKLPVAVNKATPYNFDLGLLLATDPNPVSLPTATSSDELEQALAEVARDGTQALINQLLTTCPISSTTDGVALSLPGATTPLPREKPLPTPKAMTKWQKFAAKKGIAPKTREQRRNITFDEESGIWRPKWGHGGLNKKGEDAPIVEVDMKKEREAKEGTSIRAAGRRERKENVRRNERMQRRNERAAEQKR